MADQYQAVFESTWKTDAAWWKLLFVRAFGTKIVGREYGYIVTLREWRGNLYLTGLEPLDE